ncbi:MAG: 4Fe-4S binding protein [Acholeplasmataceae bacterium]|nr:4Fe-4S binding protein [Acholeplasmataceae bacterium]
MLNKSGVPTKEQVLSRFFDEKTLIRPKAILECYEDIPCNPCETSCPFDAIVIGENMNTQPKLIVDKCTGCGICVTSCPGLAIIVAQLIGNLAVFKIPYELLPLPKKGEEWFGINRNGDVICDAKIEAVLAGKKQDHTALVTVSVPKKWIHDFVTIRGKNE